MMKNAKEKLSLMEAMTERHQALFNTDRYQLEIEYLKLQFPAIFLDPEAEDLIWGRVKLLPIGFFPQEGGLGYHCMEEMWEEFEQEHTLDFEDLKRIAKLKSYWKDKTTTYNTRQAYPADVAEVLPSDNWFHESGVGFPLYRMAGAHQNYDALISKGLPGLKDEVLDRMNEYSGDAEKVAFLKGMLSMLNVVSETAEKYADHIDTLNHPAGDKMSKALRSVANQKPQSFYEGIQLVQLWSMMSGAFNYSRMDIYLGDLLASDLDNGVISEQEAISYIESLWRLIIFRNTIFDGRVIIGGRGRRNPENADCFAKLAIQASRNVAGVLPQLTLRFDVGQDPTLYEDALEAIGEGCSFPMLYNDQVNIPAVSKAFGVSMEEAEHYLPYGCGEYVLNHRSFGTPNGVINLAKAVEVCLYGGYDLRLKNIMGVECKTLAEVETFEEFEQNYKAVVERYVTALAKQQKIEYDVVGQEAGFLMYSALFDDCIGRAKPIFAGGLRHLGGTIETYGNTNAADSLLAIKQLVFEQKKFTGEQVMELMASNYEQNPSAQKAFLNVPKYGNDIEEADEMLINVHNHVCNFVREQGPKVGLDSYLVVNINNHANTILGRHTGATPDGRKDGEHMANANNPQSGQDKNGITAVLNSLIKPAIDIHAGSVQNMKFSKEMFNERRLVTKALLNTYFENGGSQAMISVLGKEDLQGAIERPQDYPNLIVRVGGFSSRFIDLAPDVQQEILHRTLY